MPDSYLQVELKGVLPTPSGAGVFLQAEGKAITIFIDPMVARALTQCLAGEVPPRPLTHDLLGAILQGLEVRVDKVLITHMQEETFYARLFLHQSNELGEALLEVDARPSDCLVLALQSRAPIFVARDLWENCEDTFWALESLQS